jgi:DNA polymerase-3 subunit delta'
MLGHVNIKEDLSRLKESGRLAHGYLFFGPLGVGKSSFAKELAWYLENGNWEEGQRPLSDAFFISPDEGGTIGIDTVRSVRSFLSERPNVSQYRLVVVNNANALTTEAQNALLKVAEEPPAGAMLILIVTEKESLLSTLVSRLQSVYFGRVAEEEIVGWLVQNGIPKKDAVSAAELSDGKPGLALMIAKGEVPENVRLAKEFLSVAPASRKDFLKALLEPEEFSFKGFLDGLMMALAMDKKRNRDLWHAVLELRQMSDATGLSPAIQLRNLWTLI